MSPTTNRLIVVSRSARWLMANRSNGRVRKKSNDRAEDADARTPARRFPRIAMAATTATRMSAAAVPARDARAGTRQALTPSGMTTPQMLASESRLALAARSTCLARSRQFSAMSSPSSTALPSNSQTFVETTFGEILRRTRCLLTTAQCQPDQSDNRPLSLSPTRRPRRQLRHAISPTACRCAPVFLLAGAQEQEPGSGHRARMHRTRHRQVRDATRDSRQPNPPAPAIIFPLKCFERHPLCKLPDAQAIDPHRAAGFRPLRHIASMG